MLSCRLVARSLPAAAANRHGWKNHSVARRFLTILKEPSAAITDDSSHSTKTLFLHVSPSGDVWTGYSLFAAKHLQPNYVKSLPLDSEISGDQAELLLELLEDNLNDGGDWAQSIYDEGYLPKELVDAFEDACKR